MARRWPVVGVVLAGLMSGLAGAAFGQGGPTATQPLELSVFGAGTGTYTGLYDGRNAGITAGVDLTFRSYFKFQPALELRGNAAVVRGDFAVGEKSVLIGPRISRTFGRFHPYVDGFYGRAQLKYPGDGVIVNDPVTGAGFLYKSTTTNVFAGGGGMDFRVTPHFDLKLDAQYERLKTPVGPSEVIYAKPLSVGVVYHLDFNRHHRRRSR